MYPNDTGAVTPEIPGSLDDEFRERLSRVLTHVPFAGDRSHEELDKLWSQSGEVVKGTMEGIYEP
jgi:hypothetical protein